MLTLEGRSERGKVKTWWSNKREATGKGRLKCTMRLLSYDMHQNSHACYFLCAVNSEAGGFGACTTCGFFYLFFLFVLQRPCRLNSTSAAVHCQCVLWISSAASSEEFEYRSQSCTQLI